VGRGFNEEYLTLTNRRFSTVLILLLASLLASSVISSAAAPRSRRAQATDSFNRAEILRAKLSAKPEKDRQISDYRVIILAYHAVYRLDPGYGKAPVALENIAELYREMGRVFDKSSYFAESIKAYQFVAREYPHATLSHEALLNIGDVDLTDLHQPEEAQKAVEEFLAQYPRSGKAADAKAKLEIIKQTIAANHAPQPATTVTSVATADSSSSGGVPQVTEIRHWVGPHYTRIVIGMDGGEAKFETMRLANPDRIVLDLLNTHLSKTLAGMTFPVSDGFLKRVRVGQYKPGVTRVVLDVEKVEDYFVFPLPNPFRLVVDIHGPQGEAAPIPEIAKATPPRAATAAGPAEVAENVPQPSVAKAKDTSLVHAESDKPKESPDTAASTLPAVAAEPVRAAGPTESGSRTLTRALGLKIGKIVIDPGHGGHDTGTIGPSGLEEKNLVLDVSLRLAELLRQEAGSDVILTRSTDTFIPLEERTAIANEKGADLFISVHANSSRDRSARGVETYYMNFTSDPGALEVAARENATSQESVHELRDLIKKIALTEKTEESHEFATQVQNQLYSKLEKATGRQKDRGVKRAPFVVLIGANMPSVLAEISFLSNPRDERLLKKPEYRQKIAEALCRGVLDYARNLGGIRVAQRATADRP
jgi:N-acetylmuramoyl-L-alanine amidase